MELVFWPKVYCCCLTPCMPSYPVLVAGNPGYQGEDETYSKAIQNIYMGNTTWRKDLV